MTVPRAGQHTGEPHPARYAVLIVIPYLLLGLVWTFSNPPGASPDEEAHLLKALAAGRLQIGSEYNGPDLPGPVGKRNTSIARDVEIPAALAPDGYTCTAFKSEQTAACQPDHRLASSGTVVRTTYVGAYPPFAYVPLGLAARTATSPGGAFVAARLASLLVSLTFLLAGVWHIVRWLGRASAVGVVLALTPMAMFASSSVSTSGLEIMSAVALGGVAVVASRHPESLSERSTIWLMAVSGSTLVLSRQLGVATLALLTVLTLTRGGGRVVWDELRSGRRAMWAAAVAVAGSLVLVAAWERAYDHPSDTGGVLDAGAVQQFFNQLYHYVSSGVGEFGYLDTPLPGIAVGGWIAMASLVGGVALLVGRRADRWSLAGAMAAALVVAYVISATVFYPIGAGVQGRHLIPIFSIVSILAGVVVVEVLPAVGRDATWRLFVAVGTVMAGLQLLSLLLNARRYAVGSNGPVMFLADAEWSPRLGWVPWLALAALASIWLAIIVIGSAPSPAQRSLELDHVEG